MNVKRALICPYGTRITFSGREEGDWIIEIDAMSWKDMSAQRVRMRFRGVVAARFNDENDKQNEAERVLSIFSDSEWLSEHQRAYVDKHGSKFLKFIIKDLKHFVVHGHDMCIGLLARKIVDEGVI
jgi:hypothetical protein